MFKEIARYVPERKKWFVYDGKRWVHDIANLKIMELGKDLADAMLIYTSTIKDEKKRLLFLKESKYWQQRRFSEPISRMRRVSILCRWNDSTVTDICSTATMSPLI